MDNIMSLSAFRFLPGWVIAAFLFAASGCTFDSSLRDVACDNEGAISQGRLCEGGRWIQLDEEQDATPDTQAPRDTVGEDIQPPIDAAGEDTKPPNDAAGEDTRPPTDAIDADTEPPTDATDADTEPPIDAIDADAEPPTDAIDADTEPPTDAIDADTEPPGDVIDDIQEDADTRECAPGQTRICVPDPLPGGTGCPSGIQTCEDGQWSEKCDFARSAVQCAEPACLDVACESGGAEGICYEGGCCSKRSDRDLKAALCVAAVQCGQFEVPAEEYCGESGHTIGCGRCGDGQSCQDNACCRQAGSGPNRCIGKPCATDNHCASGYCEAQIDESVTHRRCAPSHCRDGVQNYGETDLDCGGPCKKCALGQTCEDDADCSSDKCKKRSGQKVCVPDD